VDGHALAACAQSSGRDVCVAAVLQIGATNPRPPTSALPSTPHPTPRHQTGKMITRALPMKAGGIVHAAAAAAARRPLLRTRSVLAAAAQVEQAEAVATQRAGTAASAFTLGDDGAAAAAAAAELATYAELRRRPVNYSPETRFTVRARPALPCCGRSGGLVARLPTYPTPSAAAEDKYGSRATQPTNHHPT